MNLNPASMWVYAATKIKLLKFNTSDRAEMESQREKSKYYQKIR